MKPELELEDWINQWSIDKGSAVEIWGTEELRQRIRDIVDTGGDVVPILLEPEHSYFRGNEGELRAAADREVAKWAKKGYQELAFEDNMDQGELLVFKQPDWRTLKDPAKVMKAFPKRPTSDDVIDLYNVTKRLKSNQLVNFLKSVSARESALDTLVNQLLEAYHDRGGTPGSGLMLNSGDDVFLKGDDAYLVDMYWSEPRAYRAEGSAEIKVYKDDSLPGEGTPSPPAPMSEPQTWDLGDGYTLVHRGGGGFKFMYGPRTVGSIMMSRAPGSQDNAFPGRLASVQDVLIYDQGGALDTKANPHRGKGLYRRALPILKQLYGGVRSSHSGATSDDAAKAWKAVGARNVLTTDDPVKYGGSWYSLEHMTSKTARRMMGESEGSFDAARRSRAAKQDHA